MVREAMLEDIPILNQMMEEFYVESDHTLDHAESESAFRLLLEQPQFGSIWLAYNDDTIIGYITFTIAFKMEFGGLISTIDDLYVRPAARRQGYAQELIETALIECDDRGAKALLVEVDPANLSAKNLYQSFGMVNRTDNRDHLTLRLDGEF